LTDFIAGDVFFLRVSTHGGCNLNIEIEYFERQFHHPSRAFSLLPELPVYIQQEFVVEPALDACFCTAEIDAKIPSQSL
jgi:hypothetical protein